MFVLGVTGSYGSGKTTVAAMFRRRGALVFDADKSVHRLLKGRGPVVRAIGRAFGKEVMSSGGIDRDRLGCVVFNEPSRVRKLTGIIHPFVKKEAEAFIRRHARSGRLLVLDVPLLIEAGWQTLVDKVVVVKASCGQMFERLERRSGVSRAQALKRIRLQMPLNRKIKYADYVVDNRGSQADADKQVARIIKELTQ